MNLVRDIMSMEWVESVDFGVPARQQVGSWWTPSPSDREIAEGILRGNLRLEPHPNWVFGSQIEWDADPFNQRNWTFQLHSMKWLDVVRRTAEQSPEDSEFARFWVHTVFDWSARYLNAVDHPVAWMDMADGMRTIEFVLGAKLVPDDLFREYLDILRLHAEKLADPSRRVGGNHGLHQLQGLLVVASFLRDDELKLSAATDLVGLFNSEYDVEGTNKEGALAYHDLNYHWWQLAFDRLELEGIKLGSASRRLEDSRKHLAQFVRPDGNLETIGDTSPGRVLTADGSETTQFVRTRGKDGVAPSDKRILLGAGYAAGRGTWGSTSTEFQNATFYTIKWAKSEVHGHDDSTSLTVFSGGVPWLVDPGMYAYQPGRERRFFKGRSAHNVVFSSTLKFEFEEGSLVASAFDEDVDAYWIKQTVRDYGTNERILIYLRQFDAFVVADRIIKSNTVEAFGRFAQLWQLHPDTEMHVGMRTVSLKNRRSSITMRWLNRPKFESLRGQVDPMRGWYSPGYSQIVKTSSLSVIPASAKRAEWVSIISVGEFDLVPLSAKWDRGQFRMTFAIGGESKYLAFDERGDMTLTPIGDEVK